MTVTHNGVGFDQPKARARMLVHGIPPHSPFKEVDTLKAARKYFEFTSNSLEDLCRQLGLTMKGKPGFHTWLECMAGDPKAWHRMKTYNKNDVVILEQLYERLLPWINNHPNMGLLSDRPDACPKCGVEGRMIVRGRNPARVTFRVQYQCQACRGYCSGRAIKKSDVRYVP